MQDNSTFAEKIKTSQIELLYLVRGKDKGRAAWYFLQVDKMKLPIFLNKLKLLQSAFPLHDYGEIIECGWGENPPEDVVKRIQK